MSAANFHIKEHMVPGTHMREYARGSLHDDQDELKLAIKQYIPRDNPNPKRGDITIIAAHANGVVKELYEPFFDEIYAYSKNTGAFTIRSIFMADAAHQGISGIENEDKLGNDPSWFDYPRDLLNMINVLRKDMPRPLIGIGHSFGGAAIAKLAIMHPRLLSGAILLDPVIQPSLTSKSNYAPAYMSTFRRDVWPTREFAAETFRQNPFYQSWDPRVLEKHIQFALRSLPTALHQEYEARKPKPGKSPEPPATDPVTLTTTKHHEVLTFLRGNFPSEKTEEAVENHQPSRRTHPDIPVSVKADYAPFYRPEPASVFTDLPRLRPRCLYIFGADSVVSPPERREDKLAITGLGDGGNGGKHAEGAVQSVTMEGIGHFIPFEAPNAAAKHVGDWITVEMRRWWKEQEIEQREWEAIKKSKGGKGHMMMSDEYVDWVRIVGEKRLKKDNDDHDSDHSKPRNRSKI